MNIQGDVAAFGYLLVAPGVSSHCLSVVWGAIPDAPKLCQPSLGTYAGGLPAHPAAPLRPWSTAAVLYWHRAAQGSGNPTLLPC